MSFAPMQKSDVADLNDIAVFIRVAQFESFVGPRGGFPYSSLYGAGQRRNAPDQAGSATLKLGNGV